MKLGALPTYLGTFGIIIDHDTSVITDQSYMTCISIESSHRLRLILAVYNSRWLFSFNYRLPSPLLLSSSQASPRYRLIKSQRA